MCFDSQNCHSARSTPCCPFAWFANTPHFGQLLSKQTSERPIAITLVKIELDKDERILVSLDLFK